MAFIDDVSRNSPWLMRLRSKSFRYVYDHLMFLDYRMIDSSFGQICCMEIRCNPSSIVFPCGYFVALVIPDGYIFISFVRKQGLFGSQSELFARGTMKGTGGGRPLWGPGSLPVRFVRIRFLIRILIRLLL